MKKAKKFLVGLLALLSVSAFALGFVACEKDNGEQKGQEYEEEYEERHKHTYTGRIVDPTCGERGYTTYRCSGCGDVYEGNYVRALGHNYIAEINEEYLIEKTICGYNQYFYSCSVCGVASNLSTFVDWNSDIQHIYPDEWIVDEEKHIRYCSGYCTGMQPEQGEHEYEDGVCVVCGYEFIEVESISLEQEIYYSDRMGTKARIKPIIEPSNATIKTLDWTFSEGDWIVDETQEEGVYSVNNLNNCTATLTITTYNGKTVSCTVVSEYCIEELRFSQNEYTLEVGSFSNGAISYYQYPSYGNCDLILSVADESVAMIYDGQILALKEGTTTLTMSTHSGLSDTCTLICVGEIAPKFVLNTPSCPTEIANWSNPAYFQTQTATINTIEYTFSELKNIDMLDIKITVKGKKTWCKYTGSYQFKINYKLYDGDGVVVKSGTMSSYSCDVGENFVINETITLRNFDFDNMTDAMRNYTITFSDVAW